MCVCVFECVCVCLSVCVCVKLYYVCVNVSSVISLTMEGLY